MCDKTSTLNEMGPHIFEVEKKRNTWVCLPERELITADVPILKFKNREKVPKYDYLELELNKYKIQNGSFKDLHIYSEIYFWSSKSQVSLLF